MGRKFAIFALFYFVSEGKFQVQAPQGAYIRRGDLTEGFLCYWFWGAYTWRGLFSEFYGMLWELINWSPKRKCFDFISNSLSTFFKEMYRDQFGEFICGYWGLKGSGLRPSKTIPYNFWDRLGGQAYFWLVNGCPDYYQVQVQVLVHLFTLIQLQYNNKEKKEEVKTELTIHNKGQSV